VSANPDTAKATQPGREPRAQVRNPPQHRQQHDHERRRDQQDRADALHAARCDRGIFGISTQFARQP